MVAKLTRLTQNTDITASGREPYHLQFSVQAASPESFGYTLIQSEIVFSPYVVKHSPYRNIFSSDL